MRAVLGLLLVFALATLSPAISPAASAPAKVAAATQAVDAGGCHDGGAAEAPGPVDPDECARHCLLQSGACAPRPTPHRPMLANLIAAPVTPGPHALGDLGADPPEPPPPKA